MEGARDEAGAGAGAMMEWAGDEAGAEGEARGVQTRGNCLCSASLSGAAPQAEPLGISVGMPDITLIPQ